MKTTFSLIFAFLMLAFVSAAASVDSASVASVQYIKTLDNIDVTYVTSVDSVDNAEDTQAIGSFSRATHSIDRVSGNYKFFTDTYFSHMVIDKGGSLLASCIVL